MRALDGTQPPVEAHAAELFLLDDEHLLLQLPEADPAHVAAGPPPITTAS